MGDLRRCGWRMQVLGLGTDTGDSAPSVLLFFDHYRFLFNAGEGFQRFCVQHRIRMGKTTAIFGTRSTTQALGGLPGVSNWGGSPLQYCHDNMGVWGAGQPPQTWPEQLW